MASSEPRGPEKRIVWRRAITAFAVLLILLGTVAVWEFVIRGSLPPSEEAQYGIEVWVGGSYVGRLTLEELRSLDAVEFVNTKSSGKVENGPLVVEAIRLIADVGSLEPATRVVVGSTISDEERVLAWEELSNESDQYILAYTNHGTVKFTSPTLSRNEKVRDVTYIRLGE